MSRISKFFCCVPDIDAEESSHRRNELVPENTSGQLFQPLSYYALRAVKYGNGYLISEAHFLPNGKLHDIVISFDSEERTKMMVAIDNKIVSELDIKDELEGTAELYLNDPQYLRNGIVVDFKWKLSPEPKSFGFYTKASSRKMATSSSSNNNDDNVEPEQENEVESYVCGLHVYPIE
ncbi:hypothetical protein KFK09_021203 [Dendrobium nobile]|uniref:Uncharacterized protein n=1 Tax=Dendrobium nobile TaxID=94219 RepID=A0A8T3AQG3_DENNO|nr:hypothetical protein KFK09_021203 [Dendrobium nobile]